MSQALRQIAMLLASWSDENHNAGRSVCLGEDVAPELIAQLRETPRATYRQMRSLINGKTVVTETAAVEVDGVLFFAHRRIDFAVINGGGA